MCVIVKGDDLSVNGSVAKGDNLHQVCMLGSSHPVLRDGTLTTNLCQGLSALFAHCRNIAAPFSTCQSECCG